MGLQIGYDQLSKGEKIYLKYPSKNYYNILSKITGQVHSNEIFLLKVFTLTSAYTNKYAIKVKNFFIYKFSDAWYRFNFEFAKQTKLIQMINFDINPIIKWNINNTVSNITSTIKYGKYEANRNNRHIINNNQYDYSPILGSLIPQNKFSLSFRKIFPVFRNHFANIKVTYNKIFGYFYDNNWKFSSSLKSFREVEVGNLCKASISNELEMKKSWMVNYNCWDGNNYYQPHITYGFRCLSKLVEMNINESKNQGIIGNGYNSFVRNWMTFRFYDLPFWKDYEILSKVSPYWAMETFYIHERDGRHKMDLNNSNRIQNWGGNGIWNAFGNIKYIISTGCSVKLKENMFLDFSLYTHASSNMKMKDKYINRFRLKLGS